MALRVVQSTERHHVKVRNVFSAGRAKTCAALCAATLTAALFFAPAPASALTRHQVMKRASSWIVKKVPYSQRGTFKGYRRDCSGFVSMAWKLDHSYTTRSISARAKRIPIASLRPGDAILKPGHVSLFGGWKNRAKRQYWAYEQTTWGSHARKRVRTIPRRAKALRRKGIAEPQTLTVAMGSPTS